MPTPQRTVAGSPPAAVSGPRYVERVPSGEMAQWVECFWCIRGHAAEPVPNRVLPDGCSDVILGIEGSAPAVVGTMRTAVTHPMVGAVDLFGIRFRPGGATPFLDVPLDELTDRRVGLAELWGNGAEDLDGALEPRSIERRVHLAEQVLRARLRRWTGRPADARLVARAVALLRRARGGVGVREVAAALGVGERRLERAFDHGVGLGPKALARVLRFRRLVRMILPSSAGGSLAWARLAADAGYADQPHLVREFRRLAGITPTAYLAERQSVGFVQEPEEHPF